MGNNNSSNNNNSSTSPTCTITKAIITPSAPDNSIVTPTITTTSANLLAKKHARRNRKLLNRCDNCIVINNLDDGGVTNKNILKLNNHMLGSNKRTTTTAIDIEMDHLGAHCNGKRRKLFTISGDSSPLWTTLTHAQTITELTES